MQDYFKVQFNAKFNMAAILINKSSLKYKIHLASSISLTDLLELTALS